MSTAKTTNERVAAYRARKAAELLIEVRGIYALPSQHAAIKAFAAQLAAKSKNPP